MAEETLNPRSAKNKGLRLSKKLKEILCEELKIHDEDIVVTPSGCSGTDLKLSPAAQKKFPFSVECKNRESIEIWKALSQAEANANYVNPGLVVFKRNRSEIYACLKLKDLMALLKRALVI